MLAALLLHTGGLAIHWETSKYSKYSEMIGSETSLDITDGSMLTIPWHLLKDFILAYHYINRIDRNYFVWSQSAPSQTCMHCVWTVEQLLLRVSENSCITRKCNPCNSWASTRRNIIAIRKTWSWDFEYKYCAHMRWYELIGQQMQFSSLIHNVWAHFFCFLYFEKYPESIPLFNHGSFRSKTKNKSDISLQAPSLQCILCYYNGNVLND